jgi:hypothetical protein
LAILLATIGFVGIFVRAVLNAPAPGAADSSPAAETAPGQKRLVGRAGPWLVTAEIAVGPADAVAVSVSVADREGRPATPAAPPTASLQMVDMRMGTQPVALARDASGRWRGSASLAMAGRWSLRVDVDGGRLDVPFEAKFR